MHTLSDMFPNILTENQLKILPLLEPFNEGYYLAGGTAIALHIGHRKSIDFDLFTAGRIKRKIIKNWINHLSVEPVTLLHEQDDQIHITIENVRVTFFSFPFELKCSENIHGFMMPSLITLSALKAFALGGRAKWKDYVDLFFILSNYFSLKEVIGRADELFTGKFNGRLFRNQLRYFDDIDYEEKVEYLVKPVPEEKIKEFLTDISLELF